MPAEEIHHLLERHLSGERCDPRLERVLRIEWEARSLDAQRCEIRVVVALAHGESVWLGTVTTERQREDLPDFLRHELLFRSGREATFILLDRGASTAADSAALV
jgi:hypothetical protein